MRLLKICWILPPVVVFLLSLSACGPKASPAPTASGPSTAITPAAGKGALVGQISAAAAFWPDDEVVVYAAPFSATNGQDGYYVLEPNVHPHASLGAGGAFALNNIEPGQYVLVVGPDPRQARLAVGADGKPHPYTVAAGEVKELGEIKLAP